ncbi:MAG: lysophospholipid acyltransferase family protein [Bacteroidetes bacterium]|nr:lysophospholipid acyltransferase family protein [Bacteroidota bacterium]
MLLYIMVLPFLYLLSLLPTGALYVLADGMAWLLERVVRYRRTVIYTNLRNSFPDKNEKEIKLLAHEFYGHFADMLVENIKALTISPEELQKRISVPGVREVFQPYWDQKRNVVVVLGHAGAWQWAGLVAPSLIPQRLFAFYNPLTNKYFDSYIKQTRSRYGMHLVSMRDYLRHVRGQYSDVSSLHFFLFDQGPVNVRKAYWTSFLHQDTAFYLGPAHFAQEHDCAVLYVAVKYQSRGKYLATITEVVEDARSVSDREIIERCVRLLEQQIEADPSDWLWSHRRWKRKRPAIADK